MPENTGEIQVNGRFTKGKSGNPKGKPKGSKHKASLMAEMLFESEASSICNQVIEQAKQGNMQAAKIILDRLLPPRKDRPICLDLPPINDINDAIQAGRVICHAVGTGEITPLEAESLSKIIEFQTKILNYSNFKPALRPLKIKLTKVVNFRTTINLAMTK